LFSRRLTCGEAFGPIAPFEEVSGDSRCRVQFLSHPRVIEMHPGDGCGRGWRVVEHHDLFAAVTEHAAKERAKAKRERWIQRLIDKLQRGE
jgi:hypothetical protein